MKTIVPKPFPELTSNRPHGRPQALLAPWPWSGSGISDRGWWSLEVDRALYRNTLVGSHAHESHAAALQLLQTRSFSPCPGEASTEGCRGGALLCCESLEFHLFCSEKSAGESTRAVEHHKRSPFVEFLISSGFRISQKRARRCSSLFCMILFFSAGRRSHSGQLVRTSFAHGKLDNAALCKKPCQPSVNQDTGARREREECPN